MPSMAHHWTSHTDIQCSKFNQKNKDLSLVKSTRSDYNIFDCMQARFKFQNHSFQRILQVLFQKPVHFLKTENSGVDQQHHLKEMVCSTSTLQTSIPELFTHCSSFSCCTDGGVMPLTVCTEPNTRTTMNSQKTCMTSLTLVYPQLPKSSSDQVDRSLFHKTKFNLCRFYLFALKLPFTSTLNFFTDRKKLKIDHQKFKKIQFQHQNRVVYQTYQNRINQTKMLRKNLTIRCEDDSLQFDIERRPQVQTTKHQRTSISPFSKTSKKFEFFNSLTSCQTPKTNDYPRQSFEFKSPKYAGIIEKNVLERLKLYEQRNKDRKHGEDVSTRAKIQEAYIRELRDKPQINDISKDLFEKVKKEKRLSPNILQRFQTYQCQRVSRNAKYQLCRASGLEVKNTTSSCRNNIKNHLSKSKSPLKQRTQNRSKSKSLIKQQKQGKHSQNIGKIITRPQKTYKCENSENIVPQMTKPKQQFFNHHSKNTQKILIKCNTDYQCDSPWSFTPNQTNKQFKKSVKNQQLSPISQKKSFTKSKKWTVLI